MEINTNAGKTYTVVSEAGCTVATADGKLIKEIAAGQDYFTAISGKTVISDDAAECVEVFKVAPIGGSGGGTDITFDDRPTKGSTNAVTSGGVYDALSGSPRRAIRLDASSDAGLLNICHDVWFVNSGSRTNVVVYPSTVTTRVQTCYLQTSIPVTLAGVTWLYGEPAMAEGYTYVIALQQLDASTVLANLAYTLPQ